MRIRFDRPARRYALREGGVITLQARAVTGCLVTRDIEVSIGKPEDLGPFTEVEAGGVRVLVAGVLEGPDGTPRPSTAVLPERVRVRLKDGALVALA